MRIIGGIARSLPLTAPRTGTRPTSDRVREALFSALDARDAIDGARVLDLYAGSGALALEAISRGAQSAVLVEKHAAAAGIAKKNAAKVQSALGSASRGSDGASVRVVTASVLSHLRAETGTFDLVFADPPYDLPAAELRDVLALLVPRLSPDALVLIERSSRDYEVTAPDGVTQLETRRYGETAVTWYAPSN